MAVPSIFSREILGKILLLKVYLQKLSHTHRHTHNTSISYLTRTEQIELLQPLLGTWHLLRSLELFCFMRV